MRRPDGLESHVRRVGPLGVQPGCLADPAVRLSARRAGRPVASTRQSHPAGPHAASRPPARPGSTPHLARPPARPGYSPHPPGW
jgi:hypothetical protein